MDLQTQKCSVVPSHLSSFPGGKGGAQGVTTSSNTHEVLLIPAVPVSLLLEELQGVLAVRLLSAVVPLP